jgi:hypothetical protein
MDTIAADNLTGTYYPAAPGARTWREARPLYIGRDRVSAEITADRQGYVFVGLHMVFAGAIPADVQGSADVTRWAREVALSTLTLAA